jgi:hypothetical protein
VMMAEMVSEDGAVEFLLAPLRALGPRICNAHTLLLTLEVSSVGFRKAGNTCSVDSPRRAHPTAREVPRLRTALAPHRTAKPAPTIGPTRIAQRTK